MIDIERLQAELAEGFRRRGELNQYILIVLGFSPRSLTTRGIAQQLPKSASRTLTSQVNGSAHYGSRGNELIDIYLESNLERVGLIKADEADGRRWMLTEQGEEILEKILEHHERDPEFLPDLPEMLEALAA